MEQSITAVDHFFFLDTHTKASFTFMFEVRYVGPRKTTTETCSKFFSKILDVVKCISGTQLIV